MNHCEIKSCIPIFTRLPASDQYAAPGAIPAVNRIRMAPVGQGVNEGYVALYGGDKIPGCLV